MKKVLVHLMSGCIIFSVLTGCTNENKTTSDIIPTSITETQVVEISPTVENTPTPIPEKHYLDENNFADKMMALMPVSWVRNSSMSISITGEERSLTCEFIPSEPYPVVKISGTTIFEGSEALTSYYRWLTRDECYDLIYCVTQMDQNDFLVSEGQIDKSFREEVKRIDDQVFDGGEGEGTCLGYKYSVKVENQERHHVTIFVSLTATSDMK